MVVKNFFVLIAFLIGLSVFAQTDVSFSQIESAPQQINEVELVTPKNLEFSQCVKQFSFPVEKLFYMSILALNANNFEIEELQSKMGYILFRAAGKSFLMSVVKVDSEHSMLKITPADNVYYFPYGVVYNIHKYIELNVDTQLNSLEII